MSFPIGDSEPFWIETEILVNECFNRIIDQVNERREHVLTKLRDFRDRCSNLSKSIEQLEKAKLQIEREMTDNILSDTKDLTIFGLDREISSLELQIMPFFRYQLVFDGTELKRALSTLGAIEKSPNTHLYKEIAKSTRTIEVLLFEPEKVSVNEECCLLAFSDGRWNDIMYFDLVNDEFLNSFLPMKGGIIRSLPLVPQISLSVCAIEVITSQEIVLSSAHSRSIILFQFDPRDKIKAKLISESKKFSDNIVSISCDRYTEQIYALSSSELFILDTMLGLLRTIHISCTYPQYLCVGENNFYLLDCGNPCMHVFSKTTTKKIQSIIPRGKGLTVNKPRSFSVDKRGNICIAVENLIRVFSSSGQLLHSFSGNANKKTIFVHITQMNEVIVLSNEPKFIIQIF